MSLLLILLSCRGVPEPTEETGYLPDTGADPVGETGADSGSDSAGDTSGETGEDSGADSATDSATDSGGDSGADSGLSASDADGDGYSPSSGDCDDSNAAVHPGAAEVCNDSDDDCDGAADWGRGVPVDYSAIQDAINASADSDTICVAAGTYHEQLNFGGKNVVVEGWEGAEATTIDADSGGPVVAFVAGESAAATLRGFTITDGEAYQGAGIVVSGADPTLMDLIVSGNTCSDAYYDCAGTGVYLSGSAATLTDVTITGNEQNFPGEDGIAYGYGTGVYVSGGSPIFQDVAVTDNVHAAIATVSYVSVFGVGVYLDGASLVWSGGSISGNSFSATAGVTHPSVTGGGLCVGRGGDLTLSNVVIADNDLDAYTAWGAGVYTGDGDHSFTNVIVANNSAKAENSAYGGGVYFGYSNATLTNVDIVANSVDGTTGIGGGLYAGNSGTITVVNSSFSSNLASGSGAALGVGSGAALLSTYANYDEHGSGAFEGVTSPVGSDGNIEVDPGYSDTTPALAVDWDLSLAAGSGMIDAGDPAVVDVDGSTSDIGAFGGPGAADW